MKQLAYKQFQSESEYQSDDSDVSKFQIGTYCYGANDTFAVVTCTDISVDECIILNLSQRKQKTVKIQSLKIMRKWSDIKQAKRLHQKYKNKNNNAMEITSKNQSNHSIDPMQQTSFLQQKFCGPKCAMYAVYAFCSISFVIIIGFAICFFNYGYPLVTNGNKLRHALTQSKCDIISYEIVECSYDCYECQDIVRCNKCKGLFCSKCNAAAYKYYATVPTLCGDIELESQLNYGDCPQQSDDLLPAGVEYNCYVQITDGECVYNNEHIFLFKDEDNGIAIGQNYLDMAYIGFGVAFLCFAIIIAIRCRKCIKNLPCMD